VVTSMQQMERHWVDVQQVERQQVSHLQTAVSGVAEALGKAKQSDLALQAASDTFRQTLLNINRSLERLGLMLQKKEGGTSEGEPPSVPGK